MRRYRNSVTEASIVRDDEPGYTIVLDADELGCSPGEVPPERVALEVRPAAGRDQSRWSPSIPGLISRVGGVRLDWHRPWAPVALRIVAVRPRSQQESLWSATVLTSYLYWE